VIRERAILASSAFYTRRRSGMRRWPFVAALAAVAAAFVAPQLWLLSLSLKSKAAVYEFPPRWIPSHPTAANYWFALTSTQVPWYLWNSVVVALVATATTMAIATPAAYVLSRERFRDRARLPNFIGKPVRLGGRGGDGRDRHQVGGEHLGHIEVMNVLDIDPGVVALRPHDRAQEHRAQPWDADLAVHVQVRGLGLDEHELLQDALHGWAPWSAGWWRRCGNRTAGVRRSQRDIAGCLPQI